MDLSPEQQQEGLAAESDQEVRREVAEMLDQVLDETWSEDPSNSETLGRIVQAGMSSVEEADFEAVPERVGPYRLVREIGRGGLATVHLAERDGEFSRKVAVKLIRRGLDTEDILERLRLERQILAHLDHPYIARMFEGGTTDDGRPYFVMEAIEGQRIDQWCDSRNASLTERLELFRKVCEAVEYAHQNLVLHRDIKPSNILVTEDGTPKLLDFGIAKVLDTGTEEATDDPLSAIPTLTRPGDRLLTPEFASPEQVRGEALTTAADVYSLGVVLFALLTGKRPYSFPRAQFSEVMRIVEEVQPDRPSVVVKRALRDGEEVPVRWPSGTRAEDLDNITLMALRKEPERRYGSARQLAEDVRCFQVDLPVVARKDPIRYRTTKFVRRNRNFVATGAFIFLTLLSAVIVTTHQAQIARENEALAQQEAQNTRQMYAFLEDVLVNADPHQARGEEITVLEVLVDAAEKIEEDFQSSPEVEADLLILIGTIYRNMSRHDDAAALIAKAVEIRRNLNEEQPLVRALVELGQTEIYGDRWAEAEQHLDEALKFQQEQIEPDPVMLAENLSWKAEALAERGELDEAEKLFEQAKQIHPEGPGFEAPLATLLSSMGKFYSGRGQGTKAKDFYVRSLEIWRSVEDENHPMVLSNRYNLARLTGRRDREKAAEMYRDLLGRNREIFGERSLRVARIQRNLGMTLTNTPGQALEGAEYLEQALDIMVSHHGETHADIARLHRSLAVSSMLAKDYSSARRWAEKAWEVSIQLYGEGHAWTVGYGLQVAEIAAFQKDPDAESLLMAVVDVARSAIKGDSTEKAWALFQLGLFRLNDGRPQEARSSLTEALDILQRLDSSSYWRNLQVQGELGRCLVMLGESEAGEKLLVETYLELLREKGRTHRRSVVVREYIDQFGFSIPAQQPLD